METLPKPEAIAILESALDSIPEFGALRERFELALIKAGYPVRIDGTENRTRARLAVLLLTRDQKPALSLIDAEKTIARFYGIKSEDVTRRIAFNHQLSADVRDEAEYRYRQLGRNGRKELLAYLLE